MFKVYMDFIRIKRDFFSGKVFIKVCIKLHDNFEECFAWKPWNVTIDVTVVWNSFKTGNPSFIKNLGSKDKSFAS